MASRIVSVCDAYGAMTRRRGRLQRSRSTMDAALEELELRRRLPSSTRRSWRYWASFVREPVAPGGLIVRCRS